MNTRIRGEKRTAPVLRDKITALGCEAVNPKSVIRWSGVNKAEVKQQRLWPRMVVP